MTNEVVESKVFGGRVGMVDPERLKEALANSAAQDPRGSLPNGAEYLNFSGKRGVYELGQKKENVDPQEAWLVNTPAFEDGWVCWKGGRPIATRLYALGTAVQEPNREEHGPFLKDGEGWFQAKSMTIRSIDSGRQAYFKINSVSGVSVFADLQRQITDRLLSGKPYWPVINLSASSFQSQGYTNSKPDITVMGWFNDDQVMNVLPAIFDNPDATIDLEAMFAEAEGVNLIPDVKETSKSKPAEVVKRNRRQL